MDMKQPPVTFVLTPADVAWWNNLRPAYIAPCGQAGRVVVFERKRQDHALQQPVSGKIKISDWRETQQTAGRRFTFDQLKSIQRNAMAQNVRLPSVEDGLNMLYRDTVRRSLPFVFAALAGIACVAAVAYHHTTPAINATTVQKYNA
jgi:hypothetical protein